jgi:hypothetical protein
MLFSAPLLAALIASGIAATAVMHRRASVLAAVVLGILLMHSTYIDVKYLIDPRAFLFHDGKPVLSYIRENWREGDVLFVHWDTEKVHRYYVVKRDYFGMSRYPVFHDAYPGPTVSRREKLADYAKQIQAIGDRRRIWFLFGKEGRADADIMLELLESRGKCLAKYQGPGASAYYFDFAPSRAVP